jgi:hypothetical protein
MNPYSLNINFEWSPILIIPALLIGLALSYFLYRKDDRLSQNVRKVLFVLRFLTFSILAILLLNPIIRHFENKIEEPSYVLAIDNSSSVLSENESERETLFQTLKNLKTELEKKGVEVRVFTSEGNVQIDSIEFDGQQTNLSSLLNTINKNYENRNLSGVLLVSDGLYNRGSSPVYGQFGMNISTLGLGDTSEIRDVLINDVRYNEVAFLDNIFPLRVAIQQSGFAGDKIEIQVENNGKVLEKKEIQFKSGENLKEVDFKLNAETKGQQKYTISGFLHF